jgi:predicted DNA binding CopG/RHH family protein
MDKKDLKGTRGIIPGYENGHYEPAANYDRSEFRTHSLDDPKRRDNRISVRVSGQDLERLHKLSLEAGVPSQSLIATILHKYVNGLLLEVPTVANSTRAVDVQNLLISKKKF